MKFPQFFPDFGSQWLAVQVVADASLPPEPCGRALQLMRFDFDGRVCLRGTWVRWMLESTDHDREGESSRGTRLLDG